MNIYGVRYCTDSRDRSMEWQRFSTRAAALRWREAGGPGGVGQPFAPDNGHRYVRSLYELQGRLPTGSRLKALMDRSRSSSDAAKANWIITHGKPVE